MNYFECTLRVLGFLAIRVNNGEYLKGRVRGSAPDSPLLCVIDNYSAVSQHIDTYYAPSES